MMVYTNFMRMPFGLRNAPASFQMLMSQVLKGLNWKFVLCYIDDILVFSSNFKEHFGSFRPGLPKVERCESYIKS